MLYRREDRCAVFIDLSGDGLVYRDGLTGYTFYEYNAIRLDVELSVKRDVIRLNKYIETCKEKQRSLTAVFIASGCMQMFVLAFFLIIALFASGLTNMESTCTCGCC